MLWSNLLRSFMIVILRTHFTYFILSFMFWMFGSWLPYYITTFITFLDWSGSEAIWSSIRSTGHSTWNNPLDLHIDLNIRNHWVIIIIIIIYLCWKQFKCIPVRAIPCRNRCSNRFLEHFSNCEVLIPCLRIVFQIVHTPFLDFVRLLKFSFYICFIKF